MISNCETMGNRLTSRECVKAMLIKESVLEIFQILSANQANKHAQKKHTGQHRIELFMQGHVLSYYLQITKCR